jgi:hypothetical protein
MVRTDSYESSGATYECNDCLHRQPTDEFPGDCPECGGEVRNIAVPRE